MRSRLMAAAAAIGLSLTAAAYSAAPAPAAEPRHALVSHGRAGQSHASAPVALAAIRRAPRHPPALKPPRTGVFGTECPSLAGAHREGIRRMAAAPVATAIAATPLLSDLSRAIKVAGLTGPLNSAADLTVFAPDNSAIADLGGGNWQALLATRPDLVRALKYQIVAGRVTPTELAKGRVLTTLGGTKIYPGPSGTSYEVNNGWVLCGNLKTANATVYVVSRVLIPST
jgi:uncharacterized surface protein with fasciclin (FAS1) repeats